MKICVAGQGAFGQKHLDALIAEGNDIVAKLEAHKAKYGEYPQTLQEAGVADVQTEYGPWEYTPGDTGFRLAVGDYGKHLFSISWQPDRGTWYTDT